GEPHRLRAALFGEARVVDDRLEPKGTLPRHRVVVLRQCEPDAQTPRLHRTRVLRPLRWTPCWSASSTCPKDATWIGFAPSPARAGHPSSTCTPTPTITGRCSLWPGRDRA